MAPNMKSWHEVVQLREDVKSNELSLSMFAADLYDVMNQRTGGRRVYQDPLEFFALTHPSSGLRDLVTDVAKRLKGQSDTAGRLLAVDYGGGKTHSLIALRHLFHDPQRLPRLPGVESFVNAIGFEPPRSRVAALCFDKLDIDKGMEVLSPDAAKRNLHYPWSLLAWQIAGQDGLAVIGQEGGTERDNPPTEQYLAQLLAIPGQQGLGVLLLMDETLMYVRAMTDGASEDDWWGRLSHFFQALTEAVQKTDRCAMVASLRSSRQEDNDAIGERLFGGLANIFNRLVGETAHTVEREDIPEILRRRFFTTESISNKSTYEPQAQLVARHVQQLASVLGNQESVREERAIVDHYPFHPALIDTLYGRWTQLRTFQRTRGMLRAFAIALRDAAKWDTSPVVGPEVFLAEPHSNDLSEAASELARTASEHGGGESSTAWRPILAGELDKARGIQDEPGCTLGYREVEGAVIGVFLGSQPEPQKISSTELFKLLAPTEPDPIVLRKALHDWTKRSWFLDESSFPSDGQPERLPSEWRLGNQANLRQMHDTARREIEGKLVEEELVNSVRNHRGLKQGAGPARTHHLPSSSRDVSDDLNFHCVLLGPEAASRPAEPNEKATAFIDRATGPRSARNAVIVAVPHRDSLPEMRDRVRDWHAWQRVKVQLRQEQVDDPRLDRIENLISESRKDLTSSIRHAWSVAVTLGKSNDYEAFHVPPSEVPLWESILKHERSRIMEDRIEVDTLLPGGPNAIWPDNEPNMMAADVVNAFLRRPELRKPLTPNAVYETFGSGVQEGTFVACTRRPDGSQRQYWRVSMNENELRDSSLELFLPTSVQLETVPATLLKPEKLPNLWPQNATALAVGKVIQYFAKAHEEMADKGGYRTPIGIPLASQGSVQEAVAKAVQNGFLCVEIDGVSWLDESVEPNTIGPEALLRLPPSSLTFQELMPSLLPEAWKDDRTTGLALLGSLTMAKGHPWPWNSLCSTLQQAVSARWLELGAGSMGLPCSRDLASQVQLLRPQSQPPENGTHKGTLTCDLTQLQELADVMPEIIDSLGSSMARLEISLMLEEADQATVNLINQIFQRAKIKLRIL